MFSRYLKRGLFRHYADFCGRASRMEYLCIVSLCFILQAIFRGLGLLLGGMSGHAALTIPTAGLFLCLLIKLLLFVPICAVHVRRMHDTGRSGTPVAVLLVLFLTVNAIPFGMLLAADSHESFGVFILMDYVTNKLLSFLEGLYAPVQILHDLVMGLLISPGYEDRFLPRILSDSASILLLGLLARLMLRRGTEGDNRYGAAPETFCDPGRGLVFAVSHCLIHGYVRFEGRAGRAEYWWFSFASMILTGVFSLSWYSIVYYYISFRNISSTRLVLLVFCTLLPQLALFLPNLAVLVRRLHDRNKSGLWLVGLFCLQCVLGAVGGWSLDRAGNLLWCVIFFLLCLLTFCLLLWQLILPGTKGPNRYGPDPRAA